VDYLDRNPARAAPHIQIAVRCRRERVADDEEGDARLSRRLQQRRAIFHEVAVCDDEFFAVQCSHPPLALWVAHDGRVRLEVDDVARLEEFEASEGDVFLVAKADAYEKERHIVLLSLVFFLKLNTLFFLINDAFFNRVGKKRKEVKSQLFLFVFVV